MILPNIKVHLMVFVMEILATLLFNLNLKTQENIRRQDGFKLLLYMVQFTVVKVQGSQVFL